MKKTIWNIVLSFIYMSISACSNLGINEANTDGIAQWDFDHHVQFIQTKLSENNYQLEIIPNSKVNFSRLATFLLRKSYSLCGGYHYQLDMIQGIEGFDDKRAMPNYIFPSLIAKIECNSNRTN